MLNGVGFPRHISIARAALCAIPLLATGGTVGAQTFPKPTTGNATFNVFISSTPAGLERVGVTRTADGWLIRSSGKITGPIDLENRLFEVEYDDGWRPRRIALEGTRSGQDFSLETKFDNQTATHEQQEGNVRTNGSETVDPTAIVLPSFFFAAYEALVVRLSGAQIGDELPTYLEPRMHVDLLVREVETQEVETTQQLLTVRVYRVTFQNPGQPLDVEIWADERHRLLRVSIPSVSLEVVRQDLTLVSTRLTSAQHPGDQEVRVPVTGFSLAATVTTPFNQPAPLDGRWPAVLLVPGSGPMDRDGTMFGIPVLGQLANALADEGYLVARYDKRGVGQSGGRPESARLRDYAEDARDLVRYLEDRDDVDRDRIVVIGHSEGGWVGLIAAAREQRIDAVALIASPSTRGSEFVLEQQRNELARLQMPQMEQQEKISLQQRVHNAVLGKGSWNDIPPALRRRADTSWFRSFLEFEPAEAMRRVRQPVLIVQGELDRQVLPYHADRLEELAQARNRRDATVDVVKLAEINHLLVPAKIGGIDEYALLTDKTVSPEIVATLTAWIKRTLPRN